MPIFWVWLRVMEVGVGFEIARFVISRVDESMSFCAMFG